MTIEFSCAHCLPGANKWIFADEDDLANHMRTHHIVTKKGIDVLMDPQEKAKLAICDYWQELEEHIEPKDIVTVWFCYILGGWKTLMFINKYPSNYFEVTYNSRKQEMYLDHYRKVHNKAIPG